MPNVPNTAFASPERAGLESVIEQYQAFIGSHCREFFDSLPAMILALNQHRQVVFANLAAVKFLGHGRVEDVLGKRPGEALGCVNSTSNPAGCGTSKHCRTCGAVLAILAAVDGCVGAGDCQLLRREHTLLEGLDLHVNASPLRVGDRDFVIFAITDISHETRRRSMERIFFHDVLNLAGGINGLVELLNEDAAKASPEEFAVLSSATQTLVDEIIAQRELLAAESNDLQPRYERVSSLSLLSHLLRLYAPSRAGQGQQVKLSLCADVEIVTDQRLAQRVLGNMIKNALEAGVPGDIVTLSCEDEGDTVRLSVHNNACIPQDVQESIFHRRFSTKAASRGLGTYSMLLLSERYLKGSVGFTSTEAAGTTFFLRLPKQLEMS
jgi:signal transduction histidine kinase